MFIKNYNGFTLCCAENYFDSIKYLINRVSDSDINYGTVEVINRGYLDTLEYILQQKHYCLDAEYLFALTFFHSRFRMACIVIKYCFYKLNTADRILNNACMLNQYDIVLMILENHKKNNSNISYYIQKNFQSMIWYGNYNISKLLIEYGANVNTGDPLPLYIASFFGHIQVVKLLIDSGARIRSYDDPSIQIAIKNGHRNIVTLLSNHISNNIL